MNEKEIQRLRKLRTVYLCASLVCDPIDFMNRQKRLLHEIAEILLEPLEEYEEETNDEE